MEEEEEEEEDDEVVVIGLKNEKCLKAEDFSKDRKTFWKIAQQTLKIIKTSDTKTLSLVNELKLIHDGLPKFLLKNEKNFKDNVRFFIGSWYVPLVKALLVKDLGSSETYEAVHELTVRAMSLYLKEWNEIRVELIKIKNKEKKMEERELKKKVEKGEKMDEKEALVLETEMGNRKKTSIELVKVLEKRLFDLLSMFSLIFNRSTAHCAQPNFFCSCKRKFRVEYRIDKLKCRGSWNEGFKNSNITNNFKNKKMSVLFVLYVFHFCRLGGMKLLMDELFIMTDFSYVYLFLDIFEKILPAVKKTIGIELLKRLVDGMNKRFSELSEEDVKEFIRLKPRKTGDKIEFFLRVIQQIDVILKKNEVFFGKSIDRSKMNEVLRLSVFLGLFRREEPFTKIGVHGISQFATMIQVKKKRSLGKMFITPSYLFSWFFTNKIVLSIVDLHQELVVKQFRLEDFREYLGWVTVCIESLVNSDILSKPRMKMILDLLINNPSKGKKLTFFHFIETFLLPKLPEKRKKDFFDVVMTIKVEDFKVYPWLLKLLTIACFGDGSSCFNVLMNLIQDENFISNEVQDTAREELINFLRKNDSIIPVKVFKRMMEFLVTNIETMSSVFHSIVILEEVLRSGIFKRKLSKSKGKQEKDGGRLLKIILFLLNFVDYIVSLNFSKLKIKIVGTVNSLSTLEVFKRRPVRRSIPESQRFFLKRNTRKGLFVVVRNFIKCLCVECKESIMSIDYCQRLWKHLSRDNLDPEEKNFFVQTLSVFSKAKFNSEEMIQFFEKVVMDFSPYDVDRRFVRLFVEYIIAVNKVKKNILVDLNFQGVKTFESTFLAMDIEVVNSILTGLGQLWEVILKCEDPVASKDALNILNDLKIPLRINNTLCTGNVEEPHIKECLGFIHERRKVLLGQTTVVFGKSEKSELAIRRCLMVLQDYVLLLGNEPIPWILEGSAGSNNAVRILSKFSSDIFRLLYLSEKIGRRALFLLLCLPVNKVAVAQISDLENLNCFPEKNSHRFRLYYALWCLFIRKDTLRPSWKRNFAQKKGIIRITTILLNLKSKSLSQTEFWSFGLLLACLNVVEDENRNLDVLEAIVKLIFRVLLNVSHDELHALKFVEVEFLNRMFLFPPIDRKNPFVHLERKRGKKKRRKGNETTNLNVVSTSTVEKGEGEKEKGKEVESLLLFVLKEVFVFFKNSFIFDNERFLKVIFQCSQFREFVQMYFFESSCQDIIKVVEDGLIQFSWFSDVMNVVIDIFFLEKLPNKSRSLFMSVLRSSRRIWKFKEKATFLVKSIRERNRKCDENELSSVALMDAIMLISGKNFNNDEICLWFFKLLLSVPDRLLDVLNSKVPHQQNCFCKIIYHCLKTISGNYSRKSREKMMQDETWPVSQFVNVICGVLKSTTSKRNIFEHSLKLVEYISCVGTVEMKFFLCKGILGRICDVLLQEISILMLPKSDIRDMIIRLPTVASGIETIATLVSGCRVNSLSCSSPCAFVESVRENVVLRDSERVMLLSQELLSGFVQVISKNIEDDVKDLSDNLWRILIHLCWGDLGNSLHITRLILNSFSKQKPYSSMGIGPLRSPNEVANDTYCLRLLSYLMLIRDSMSIRRVKEMGNIFVQHMRENVHFKKQTFQKIKWLAKLAPRSTNTRHFFYFPQVMACVQEILKYHDWTMNVYVTETGSTREKLVLDDNIYTLLDGIEQLLQEKIYQQQVRFVGTKGYCDCLVVT